MMLVMLVVVFHVGKYFSRSYIRRLCALPQDDKKEFRPPDTIEAREDTPERYSHFVRIRRKSMSERVDESSIARQTTEVSSGWVCKRKVKLDPISLDW